MNNNISKLFMFAMGAAIGSFSAWLYAKKKYEKIANDEIRSMREYFRRREKELLEDDDAEEIEEPGDEPESSDEENDKGIYSNIIKESGYVRYGKSSNQNDSEEDNDVDDEPYVIRPVDDPDTLVGTDFADCFNVEEVDGDVVYVRNERKKMDFEIIEDLRNYSDVMKNKMRLEEDE